MSIIKNKNWEAKQNHDFPVYVFICHHYAWTSHLGKRNSRFYSNNFRCLFCTTRYKKKRRRKNCYLSVIGFLIEIVSFHFNFIFHSKLGLDFNLHRYTHTLQMHFQKWSLINQRNRHFAWSFFFNQHTVQARIFCSLYDYKNRSCHSFDWKTRKPVINTQTNNTKTYE